MRWAARLKHLPPKRRIPLSHCDNNPQRRCHRYSKQIEAGRPLRTVPVQQEQDIVESDVPARLDRLPWSGWHWRIVIALSITWLLDGLETTLGGALVGILKDPRTLHLTDSEIGLSATVYLAGAVAGALVFGYERTGLVASASSSLPWVCTWRP